MEKSLPNYYDHAETILNAIPEAVAIACDENGEAFVYFEDVPELHDSRYVWKSVYGDSTVGEFTCPDWKASLIIKKVERWKPEEGEKYYHIRQNMIVDDYIFTGDAVDDAMIAANNCFQTRQQAEDKLILIKEVLNG